MPRSERKSLAVIHTEDEMRAERARLAVLKAELDQEEIEIMTDATWEPRYRTGILSH